MPIKHAGGGERDSRTPEELEEGKKIEEATGRTEKKDAICCTETYTYSYSASKQDELNKGNQITKKESRSDFPGEKKEFSFLSHNRLNQPTYFYKEHEEERLNKMDASNSRENSNLVQGSTQARNCETLLAAVLCVLSEDTSERKERLSEGPVSVMV